MLTQEIARELLDYDPETGKLFWRERDRRWFTRDRLHKSYNARYAGKEAFTASDGMGYLHGNILGKTYRIHLIIWLYQTGEFPKEQIDHINHIKNDNRWINLREASHLENAKNQSQKINNTSGVTGVVWDKSRQKWIAQIMANKRYINLGRFSSFEEAVLARKEAEITYGFHENHGVSHVLTL